MGAKRPNYLFSNVKPKVLRGQYIKRGETLRNANSPRTFTMNSLRRHESCESGEQMDRNNKQVTSERTHWSFNQFY